MPSRRRTERPKLAIVMVGLPARGKSYTARKISRYLSWLGYRNRVFNVGEYRRERLGAHMQADFFDPDNEVGREARRRVAMEALDDMLRWQEHAEVGIYDATNSSLERRRLVRNRCEAAGVHVIFVEIHCDDPGLVEANIRATKVSSPDYENVDPTEAVRDFRARIAHYERDYEPLNDDEGSWLRMTDTGKKLVANRVDGYLEARLGFFLMNLHLTDRPIWLTRHGESVYNMEGLIGGDADLTPHGQRYAHSLADTLDLHLPDPDAMVIFTSSLRRALQTANPLGRPSYAWRALDEIDAGICDGMSYQQIREQMPDEFEARKQDKFRYRYPRGESYQDVIQRIDPVILEIERTRKPVLVIAHQAVLRALYSYFMGLPPEDCPHLSIPLHTLIQLEPHAYGCNETRVPLTPQTEPRPSEV